MITKKLAISFVVALLGAVGCNVYANDCFDHAAAWQGIDVTKLRSISMQENRRCDTTVMTNKNKSNDLGCMQINSVHLAELSRYKIQRSDLLEPDQCKNIFIGAWHYKKMVIKYGDTWTAVGAYHNEKPFFRDPYAAKVKRIWERHFAGRATRPTIVASQ